jgi:hypothetical protein
MLAFLFMLAQTEKPEDTAGLAERLNKGGVPVISLFFALAFAAVAVYLFKQLQKANEKAETKAEKDKTDAENRVKEAKTDGDKKEGEKILLMKERFASEKEVIEENTRFTERVDKKLDQVDDLKRLLVEMNDRVRRLEERRA